MKRILSLALVMISIFTLASCSREEGEAPFGMIKASSDAAEFYLYVPNDWVVTTEENSLMASARASESDPSNITMIGFEDGSGEYADIDAFWAYYKNELASRIFDFAGEGDERATTFNLTLEGEGMIIDDVPAKKYEYSGKLAGSDLSYMMVIAKIDSVFYIITYTSSQSLYSKHADKVNALIEYIEFK